MFYAYILKSLNDGSYYYGSSKNVEQRIKEHNAGKVRYTKGHKPYVLRYKEMHSTRREALARERYFKSIDGYLWLKSMKII